MKKQVITITTAILFAFGSATLVGCGDSHSHDAESHEHHEHASFQCPMDCEEGKVYDHEGSCPVCGMDLVEVES